MQHSRARVPVPVRFGHGRGGMRDGPTISSPQFSQSMPLEHKTCEKIHEFNRDVVPGTKVGMLRLTQPSAVSQARQAVDRSVSNMPLEKTHRPQLVSSKSSTHRSQTSRPPARTSVARGGVGALRALRIGGTRARVRRAPRPVENRCHGDFTNSISISSGAEAPNADGRS